MKILKKIILCITLSTVLVASMVFPAFAYTNETGNITTWYDYLGAEDLNYAVYSRDISIGKITYDTTSFPDCVVLPLVVDPTVFGNFATYNGTFSLKLARSLDNLVGSYMYDLGYFEFQSSNRFFVSGTSDGAISAYLYDYQKLVEYAVDNKAFPPEAVLFAEHIRDFCEYDPGYGVNTKLLFLLIDKDFFANINESLFLGLQIYPGVQTMDDIYRKLIDNYKPSLELLDITLRQNQDLQAENDSLLNTNGNLTEQVADLTGRLHQAQNDVGIYEQEVIRLTQANKELEADKANLANSNEVLKIENNSLRNDLENTNSLTALGNGIGQGFTNIIDAISGLGVGGITIGGCISVLVVIFVVFVIIKLVLR